MIQLITALVTFLSLLSMCEQARCDVGSLLTAGPFGMSNRALGVAPSESSAGVWDFLPGSAVWQPRNGAPTDGLLVRTWGKVQSTYFSPTTGAHWFYIDDGSGAVSDYGDTGVIIYSDADVHIGDFVSVTGTSETEPSFDDPNKLVRVVSPRDAADVQLVNRPEALYPFSDEFDGPELDKRWKHIGGTGELSLTREPGWLSLTQGPPPDRPWLTGIPWCLTQPACDDWDLEVKLRVDFTLPDSEPFKVQEIAVIRDASYDYQKPLVSTPFAFAVAGLTSYYEYGVGNVRRVIVAGQAVSELAGDTCCFRVRCRGDVVHGSYSFDGITYSPEFTGQYGRHRCLTIYAHQDQLTSGSPARGYVDYFRLTKPGP